MAVEDLGQDPSSFLQQFSQFSSGNMMVDMLLSLSLGNSFAPRPAPGSGQSPADIMQIRQRTMEFQRLNAAAFLQQQFFQQFTSLQMNKNSGAANMIGSMLGQPDSIFWKFISPLTGGNPALAMQNMYARSNAMMMGNFGQVGPASGAQVMSAYEAMASQFYGGTKGTIDFRTTRGFNIEDLTSAFTRAGQVNLLGDGGSKSYSSSARDFTKNATGVLDAARAITGIQSGEGLVDFLNQTLGNSALNLTKKEDADKLEKMLLDVKAAARTAGVGIKSVMGMIEELNNLANAHPDLKNTGGLMTLQRAPGLLAATQAFNMGSQAYMRSHGGSSGVLQELFLSSQNQLNEPIGRQLGALYDFLDVNGNKAGTEAILEYAKGSASKNSVGFNFFLSELQKKTGISSSVLMNVASNRDLQELAKQKKNAFNDDDLARKLGAQAQLDELLFRAQQSLGISGMQEFENDLRSGTSLGDAINRAKLGTNGAVTAAYMANQSALEFEAKLKFDGKYKEKYDSIMALQKAYSEKDKLFLKEYGTSSAPLVTQYAQQLLAGNRGLASDMIGPIRALGSQKLGDQMQYLLDFSTQEGSKEAYDTLYATFSGNTKKSALTPEEYNTLWDMIGNDPKQKNIQDLMANPTGKSLLAKIGITSKSNEYYRYANDTFTRRSLANSIMGQGTKAMIDEMMDPRIESAVRLGLDKLALDPESKELQKFLQSSGALSPEGEWDPGKLEQAVLKSGDENSDARKVAEERAKKINDIFSQATELKNSKDSQIKELRKSEGQAEMFGKISEGINAITNNLGKLVTSMNTIAGISNK